MTRANRSERHRPLVPALSMALGLLAACAPPASSQPPPPQGPAAPAAPAIEAPAPSGALSLVDPTTGATLAVPEASCVVRPEAAGACDDVEEGARAMNERLPPEAWGLAIVRAPDGIALVIAQTHPAEEPYDHMGVAAAMAGLAHATMERNPTTVLHLGRNAEPPMMFMDAVEAEDPNGPKQTRTHALFSKQYAVFVSVATPLGDVATAAAVGRTIRWADASSDLVAKSKAPFQSLDQLGSLVFDPAELAPQP
ncbi:MAG: hypothetical protein R3B72_09290 [Polyangiaceae bacterium]